MRADAVAAAALGAMVCGALLAAAVQACAPEPKLPTQADLGIYAATLTGCVTLADSGAAGRACIASAHAALCAQDPGLIQCIDADGGGQ